MQRHSHQVPQTGDYKSGRGNHDARLRHYVSLTMSRRLAVASIAVVVTLLSGWTPAQSAASSHLLLDALSRAAIAGLPAAPLQPKPFTIPAQPIVAASSDGYLPSSWNVTPKGEFTFTLPIAVPPGRAGMAP